MRSDPTGTRKPFGAVYASCHYFSPLFMLCLNAFTLAQALIPNLLLLACQRHNAILSLGCLNDLPHRHPYAEESPDPRSGGVGHTVRYV